MADRQWARGYALACQDQGLDRAKRLALIRHAIRHDVATSMEVGPTEIVLCWRALIALSRWDLELFETGDGWSIRERASVG